MTIVACKECGHGVSTQAVSCPNCGAPTSGVPAPRSHGAGTWQSIMLVLATLGVIAAAMWLAPAPHRAPPAAARVEEPAPAGANAAAAVYVTTAEQLYRDYSANAIAIQNRIGSGLVRVTGNVTEIDEDATGHPVVKLSTGGADSADMLLKDDQRGAVAQLSKGESVGIQCDKIQRDMLEHSGAPLGIGCVLLLVDAGAQPVYLAPSSEVPAKVAAAKPAGRKPARKSAGSGEERAGAVMATVALPDVPALPSLDGQGGAAVPVPVVTAFQSAAATAGSEPVAAPPVASFEAASLPSNPDVAAPADKDATRVAPGTSGAPPAAPAVAAPNAAPSASAAVPDDLAAVKARDPQAADRIASYCSGATAAAKDHASVAAGCRHEEEAAWKRLVVNNEFPALNDAMRSKCNEPPFPDSYVAKESCARYQLNAK